MHGQHENLIRMDRIGQIINEYPRI
jgi:hypothetical protein